MTVGTATPSKASRPPRERAELILSQLDGLPTLPAVAAKLISVTASSRSSVKDVAEVIESDAAISSKMLQMARSSNLGVRTESLTVSKAVSLLGFSAVRNALLSVQIYRTLPCDDESGASGFRRDAWMHNVAVACAAQMLAERANPRLDAGTAFLCGLLHDVGMIALDACLPKAYRRVIERVERERGHLCDIERDVLGIDHTIAGKRLAQLWKLPATAVECIWLHHQHPDALPSAASHADFVRLVYIADHCVRRQRIGFTDHSPIDDVEALARNIGIGEDDLAAGLGELPALMEPYLDLLELTEGSGPMVYASTLATANRELGRLNAELLETARSLAVRSRLTDALRIACVQAEEPYELPDVCLAGGEAMRVFLELESAVAFVAQPADRCLHIAATFGDDGGHRKTVVALDDHQIESALASLAGTGRIGAFASVTGPLSGIWYHATGFAAEGPLWVVPFLVSDELVGGVLVPALDDQIEPTSSPTPDMAALVGAIALSVRSKKSCIDLERMNEDLLDTNRRFHSAQKRLVRDRSISMIAEMAAGAAHELNNPLAVISARAQLLSGGNADADTAQALQTITDQAHRASQMVLELMEFAKPATPTPTLFKLEPSVNALCQHCRGEFSLRPEQLVVSLPSSALTVFADRDHLRQVLESVIANAVEAGAGESLVIQINSPSIASDETVRILIEDNGAGMSREVLEHAFDPFYSNRSAGRGRGLGLSRAYRLVDINGGKIWLDSTPGTGTTVTVELPARPPAQPHGTKTLKPGEARARPTPPTATSFR